FFFFYLISSCQLHLTSPRARTPTHGHSWTALPKTQPLILSSLARILDIFQLTDPLSSPNARLPSPSPSSSSSISSMAVPRQPAADDGAAMSRARGGQGSVHLGDGTLGLVVEQLLVSVVGTVAISVVAGAGLHLGTHEAEAGIAPS
ncbi:unnamed protein product, partial [Urochloa humidicola]